MRFAIQAWGLMLLATCALTSAGTAWAGCGCGAGSSSNSSSYSSNYLPPPTYAPPASSYRTKQPVPTATFRTPPVGQQPAVFAPLYAPPVTVPAPYGPEHVKYNYRYRPTTGMEKYEADYPGHWEYNWRRTPTKHGPRVTERYGRW